MVNDSADCSKIGGFFVATLHNDDFLFYRRIRSDGLECDKRMNILGSLCLNAHVVVEI